MCCCPRSVVLLTVVVVFLVRLHLCSFSFVTVVGSSVPLLLCSVVLLTFVAVFLVRLHLCSFSFVSVVVSSVPLRLLFAGTKLGCLSLFEVTVWSVGALVSGAGGVL